MSEPADPTRWREIEALVDAALDCPPERRSSLLDERCADDPSLRAEVESLLRAHARAGDFLEVPIASLEAALAAPLRAGDPVGPYRVERVLGRGGAGVVYLAVDTRLDRRVALKLLSAAHTPDAETRARFEREARAASALDDPHVCTVYEIGESEAGDPYIAMAYVEGETLRDRIARGPLPLPEAVGLAVQVARGLAHAHAQGIVHRDVKPANLIVTPEGDLRIVDFGLAKWTGSISLTREGTALGTVTYMSPEQILGKPVDRRTDVWALGVVLYEMITGRPPFEGENEQARAWAILHTDPEPLTSLRAGVPLALEPVLAKALAKDPDQRYQHVDELPVDLRAALAHPEGAMSASSRTRRRARGLRAVALVLAGAVVGILAVTVLAKPFRDGETRPPVHLFLPLAVGQEPVRSGSRDLAVSPDGTRAVYAAREGDRERLYLRALDDLEAHPIVGTDGARDPFFSPDGRWLGFFAGEELRKVSLDGGAPQTITEAPSANSRGASWGIDDRIVLPLGQQSGLYRVPASGGSPEAVTVPRDDGSRSAHFFPQVLPDGERVLFTVWRPGGWGVAVGSLADGSWAEIADGCAAARLLPTGHLLCAQMRGLIPTGSLLAAPFVLEDGALRDPLVPVGLPAVEGFDYDVASDGTLVYAPATPAPERSTLVWVDRAGRSTPVGDEGGTYRSAVLSPDGRRVAVTRLVEAGRLELWIQELENGTAARLAFAGPVNNLPVWWPDGERILFNSLRAPPGLYSVDRDLDTEPSLVLPRRDHILAPGSFSPDGRVLAYTELNDRTFGDLWAFSVDDGSTRPLLRTPSNERSPVFSPTGGWLAYVSDESGRDEVYVRPFPGPGPSVQLSTGGGREPVWSRDGTNLFYRSGDAVMAVPVRTGATLSADRPVRLFEGRFAGEYMGTPRYDVAPDGRFLMLELPSSPAPARLGVVLSWSEWLDRTAVPAR